MLNEEAVDLLCHPLLMCCQQTMCSDGNNQTRIGTKQLLDKQGNHQCIPSLIVTMSLCFLTTLPIVIMALRHLSSNL